MHGRVFRYQLIFLQLQFQVPPSAEDDHHLDQEIHNTVKKIIRDFVTSWYSTVSSESGFEMDVQEAMISMAMELKLRVKYVDRKVRGFKNITEECVCTYELCVTVLCFDL